MNHHTALAALTHAPGWHKSSYSRAQNDCVEIARSSTWGAVRDTKNRDAGTLTFNTTTFDAFLTNIKTGNGTVKQTM